MSDKELLELAAKAAGIINYTVCGDLLFIETGTRRGATGYYWNPLTDDGDAFRLAVKLGFTPIIDTQHFFETEIDGADIREPHNDDPYKATRRAIVRAAAEIGDKK